MQLRQDRDLLDQFFQSTPEQKRDRFLTTSQAARLCGLTRRTIGVWIENGKIDALRVGGKYFVPVDSLATFIKRLNEEM